MTMPQTAESAPRDRTEKDALWDEAHRQLTVGDATGRHAASTCRSLVWMNWLTPATRYRWASCPPARA